METQNCLPKSHLSGTDPIATVRLWLVLPLAVAATIIVMIVLAPSPPPLLERKATEVAVFATIVMWWLSAVAGATRRAGFRPPTLSAGAVFNPAAKVVLCTILATLVWVQLQHVLGLSRVGLVTAPPVVSSERTAQALAFVVFEEALLAPVAEEMLMCERHGLELCRLVAAPYVARACGWRRAARGRRLAGALHAPARAARQHAAGCGSEPRVGVRVALLQVVRQRLALGEDADRPDRGNVHGLNSPISGGER